MRRVETPDELRAALRELRADGATVGLVPTMGAFHEGHLSLMRRARARCDVVVVSLFVNPTQFGPGEDLDAYPRDLERDARLAAGEGVDLLFAPSAAALYPPGFATWVQVEALAEPLCGRIRGAAHFRGVATVVTKLLNLVAPDVAFFGQKDAQQAAVIRRLVSDLDLPSAIEVCPTVRDADGLALSSRNAYLSPSERARAVALSRALDAALRAVAEGTREPSAVVARARSEFAARGVQPEYVELVSPQTLQPLDRIEGEALLAVAARIGRARLIDNALIDVTTNGRPSRP